MFAFKGLQCGAGTRENCTKEICLATHTDDINPGFIAQSTMASIQRQIKTAKNSTPNRKINWREGRSSKRYGMRHTVDRRARGQQKINEEQVLLTLSALIDNEQEIEIISSEDDKSNNEEIATSDKTKRTEENQDEVVTATQTENILRQIRGENSNKGNERKDETRLEVEIPIPVDVSTPCRTEGEIKEAGHGMKVRQMNTEKLSGIEIEMDPEIQKVEVNKEIWEKKDQTLKISFPCSYFHQIRIRGDGHCMVQSVMESMHIENVEKEKEEVMKKLELMLYHDIDDIKTFTNHEDVDPMREMTNYIRKGKYNSAVADLIIPMLSRTLKVRIIILQKDYKSLTYNLQNNEHHVFAPVGYEKTVYVEKRGLHYNTLLPKELDNNQEHKQTQEMKEWKRTWSPHRIYSPVPATKNQEPLRKQDKEKSKKDAGIKNNMKEKEKTAKKGNRTIYCICRKPDDGSKMVFCERCEEWYHLKCIQLTFGELNEMDRKKQQYVCSGCTTKEKNLKEKFDKQEEQMKGKYELMQRKLNAKIEDQQDEIRKLKRKEEERKIKDTEDKTENRRKIEGLRETLKTRNQRIDELKSDIANTKITHAKAIHEAKVEIEHYKLEASKESSSGDKKSEKEQEKQKKQLEQSRDEISKLKSKLKETEKRCKELEEEEEKIGEDIEEGDKNEENQIVSLKKELRKEKKANKKKEREIEVILDERNKALQEKLEHTRTIRNLNDSLDLLKRINVDHEVANMNEAIRTKTKNPFHSPRMNIPREDLEHEMSTKEEDEYEELDAYFTDSEDEEMYTPEVYNSAERIPAERKEEDMKEQNEPQENTGIQEEDTLNNSNSSCCRKEQDGDRNTEKKEKERKKKQKSYGNDKHHSTSRSRYDENERRNRDRDNNRKKDNREPTREGNRYRNKVVCRYYLENKCRFKEDCWFSHNEEDIKEEAERMKSMLSFLETSRWKTEHR